jgi:hypothetical protein
MTLISDSALSKHILPEWADKHDYDFTTIRSLLSFVGSQKTVMLMNTPSLLHQSHENIFTDIHARAEVKKAEGWMIYTIPQVQLAAEPKVLIREIAQRYGLTIQEEVDPRIYDLPNTSNEVMLFIPEPVRSTLGTSVRKWLNEVITSVYADNMSLSPNLIIYGDWNQFDVLSLSSIDYAKVWFAALLVWERWVKSHIYALENTSLVSVLPDFGVIYPLTDISVVPQLREQIQAILQNPQQIQVQLCPSDQDCISSRVLTEQKYPNTYSYSLNIGGQAVLVSNAPHLILVKDPKDRIPKKDLKTQKEWQRI